MTKLSVEQLQSLQSLFPLSDSEIKDFKNFNGNVNELSNVDKFFIEVRHHCSFHYPFLPLFLLERLSSVAAGDFPKRLLRFGWPGSSLLLPLWTYCSNRSSHDRSPLSSPAVTDFIFKMLAIPRLESRFSLFIFKLQFSEQVEHLRKEAQALEACSQQVKQSDQFAKVLKWVHTLGNLLNKDTKFASAGFSLESLPSVRIIPPPPPLRSSLVETWFFFFWLYHTTLSSWREVLSCFARGAWFTSRNFAVFFFLLESSRSFLLLVSRFTAWIDFLN